MQSGNAEAAASVSVEGLGQYPEDPNILCMAARSLIALLKFDEASIHIEKAKLLHPEFSVAHETFADLGLIEGRYHEADSMAQRWI